MPEEQDQLVQRFRDFIAQVEQGGIVPPVEERDLKSIHELCVERARRYCGKDGVVSLELMSRFCGPGANLPAVWLRHTELRTMYREGLLAEWQHGTELADIVFRVAASIPMKGRDLDQASFLKQLHERSVA